jgi:hypothetical protein
VELTPAQFLNGACEDRHLIEEGLTRAIQTGEPFAQEFRGNPVRDPLRHFNAIVHATKNEEGRVVHLGGTIQDITALMEARKALYTSEREAVLGRVPLSRTKFQSSPRVRHGYIQKEDG